jgi:carbon-monoxide dehydrogenase medium subunit
VARRHGDYALCGVAAAVTLDQDQHISRARAAYISVAATPVRLELTQTLAGAAFDSADWRAARALAKETLDPEPDIHASREYRLQLAEVLTARALARAAAGAAEVAR